MKKLLRITLVGVVALLLVGVVAYFIWFYNPHPDRLRLDPESVFSEETSSNGLLIRNATLIDVEAGEAIPDTHVLIRGDTIAEVIIGEEPNVPEDVRVYDARDKYVMPGLFDMHVHLTGAAGAVRSHLIDSEFTPQDSLVTKVVLEQFVRYGVTTVLALGGPGANDEQAAELKRLEDNNAIVAPLLFATGDLITAPGSHPITTLLRLPADADAARLHEVGVTAIGEEDDPAPIIAEKKLLGLDGVKIMLEEGPPPFYPNPRMSVETADKIVEAAAKHDLPVYAHAEAYDEFADAVRIGVDGVMHSVSDMRIEDDELIERMKQEDIYYVPTLSLFYGLQTLSEKPERLDDRFLQAGVSQRNLRALENPLFRFGFGSALSEFDVSEWLETAKQNLVRLHEAGVNVALGTDAGVPFNFPGYNAHVEMELMVEAGLSNAEVLRAATINAAKFLGIPDRVGTLEPGKMANFLVLDKNPLADIRNTRAIDGVILKGRVIDQLAAN